MTSSIEFQTWLAHLPALGYGRLWIGNNLPALRQRFEDSPTTPMPQCPEQSPENRGPLARFEELSDRHEDY